MPPAPYGRHVYLRRTGQFTHYGLFYSEGYVAGASGMQIFFCEDGGGHDYQDALNDYNPGWRTDWQTRTNLWTPRTLGNRARDWGVSSFPILSVKPHANHWRLVENHQGVQVNVLAGDGHVSVIPNQDRYWMLFSDGNRICYSSIRNWYLERR